MSCLNKRPTIFLDRDGTINVDKHYLYKKEDFEFFPDTIFALKEFQKLGYQLIIVTNQSGIARGYYTIRDYKKLTRYYLRLLRKEGIKGVKVLFCPHHGSGKVKKFVKNCSCRKPQLGLFEKAIKKYKVDLNDCFAVGDKERDLAICVRYSSIKGFLVDYSCQGKGDINSLSDLIDIIKLLKEIR